MNYLSHYYIDAIEENPYHNLGLILPDLLGIYSRHFKIYDPDNHVVDSFESRQLMAGILKHFELDSIFHQSEFFLKHTTLIRYSLEELEITFLASKQHFLAHILLELIIDKVIIQRESQILENFYNDLDHIDQIKVKAFIKGKDEQFVNGFFEFFERFRTKRYLYSYTSEDAVIFLMNKVLERINLSIFNHEADLMKIRQCIIRSSQNIENDYDDLKAIRENENF